MDAYAAHAYSIQKRVSDPLELELCFSAFMWVQGIKTGPLEEHLVILTTEPSLQPPPPPQGTSADVGTISPAAIGKDLSTT